MRKKLKPDFDPNEVQSDFEYTAQSQTVQKIIRSPLRPVSRILESPKLTNPTPTIDINIPIIVRGVSSVFKIKCEKIAAKSGARAVIKLTLAGVVNSTL